MPVEKRFILVLERGQTRVAVEFKASSDPRPKPGFWSAVKDLQIDRNWIIAPVSEGFPLRHAQVASLDGFLSDERNADLLHHEQAEPQRSGRPAR